MKKTAKKEKIKMESYCISIFPDYEISFKKLLSILQFLKKDLTEESANIIFTKLKGNKTGKITRD